MNNKSVYQTLIEAIETAVFKYQARGVDEVMQYIRDYYSIHSLDRKEINRLIHKVCTSYKDKENNAKTKN